MRNDVFNPKLQEHYRLETALKFIVVLEAKLGEQSSRIAQLEDDVRNYQKQAITLNKAIQALPQIQHRNWGY
jgi:hypothetical protein